MASQKIPYILIDIHEIIIKTKYRFVNALLTEYLISIDSIQIKLKAKPEQRALNPRLYEKYSTLVYLQQMDI